MKHDVCTKAPCGMLRHVSMSMTLENLQKYVGGYVEAVPIGRTGVIVICDEDGRLKNKEFNCYVGDVPFFGDIILCGSVKGELTDIPIPFDEVRKLIREVF